MRNDMTNVANGPVELDRSPEYWQGFALAVRDFDCQWIGPMADTDPSFRLGWYDGTETANEMFTAAFQSGERYGDPTAHIDYR